MPVFCDYGCGGILTINSVPLHCPAWDIPYVAALWIENVLKGENLDMPLAQGKSPLPHRLDEAEHPLILWVTGDNNLVGTPYANPWVGMQTNLSYLYQFVFQPVTTGNGCRAATLTMPDATVRAADVQLSPLRQVDEVDPSMAQFTFNLTIPSGRFV